MAFSDPLVVGTASHAKMSDGNYILSTSTADQPTNLIIKNTINPDGVSQYLVQHRVSKNGPISIGGNPQPVGKDSILITQVQFKVSRAYTAAEVLTSFNVLTAFLATAGVFDRVMLGER